jgi:hypothetical protein
VDHGSLSRDTQEDWAFSAAVALRDAGKELIEEIDSAGEWTMRPGALGNVFQGTFARGTQTFRAVLLLCDRGYGVQAGMLNRSLFEHAVVLWWMHLHDDREWLMERIRKHHEHSRVLWDRAAQAHPELELPTATKMRPLDEEAIAELDGLFGPHGNTWHGESLAKLVRTVEERWTEPYQGMFWKFFRFVNQWNNSMLHHSAAGITDAIDWATPNAAPVLRLGPDRAWAGASLWAAHWCYGLLVLCTLRELSADRADGFRELLDSLGVRYLTITRSQVDGLSRNDPCPCGSGRKLKHCHGDRLVDDRPAGGSSTKG